MSTDLKADAASLSARGGLPLRSALFALLSAAAAVAAVLFAVHYFVAERLPELTEETLEAASARWETNGPASYDMDIELRGARPGTVHVEVRDRKVTAQTRDG